MYLTACAKGSPESAAAPPAHSPERTHEVVALVRQELCSARGSAITDVVVATATGASGLAAARELLSAPLEGREGAARPNVVVVTHSAGFKEPGKLDADPQLLDEIRSLGARVVTCGHAFHGVDRAVRNKLGTYETSELMATVYRTFGQGTKVAVECMLMAADCAALSEHSWADGVIACGGTARGLDTAWVMTAVHSQHLLDLKMQRLICKPIF
eukprot:m51a1_g5280 hypothetical protein (214) ;mRNA; f:174370-175341